MKSSSIIIGVLLLAIIIWGAVSYQKKQDMDKEGGLYIGVTDATADIKDVSDIDMTVKKVEVHSATKGWITVSSDSKSYKLLSLNASGQTQFYAKTDDVNAGTYDKVRVTLGDTTIHTKSKGDMKATLPSSQIVMNTTVKVEENKESHVTFDFLAGKSLHMTSDNAYVFAPVVKSEARSNTDVTVAEDNSMTISGGTIDSTTTVGVDLDGSSKGNFELKTGTDLKIESTTGGMIKFMLGGKSYSSDSSMNRESQSGDSVTGSTNTSIDTNLNINGSLNGSLNTNSGSVDSNGSLKLKVN